METKSEKSSKQKRNRPRGIPPAIQEKRKRIMEEEAQKAEEEREPDRSKRTRPAKHSKRISEDERKEAIRKRVENAHAFLQKRKLKRKKPQPQKRGQLKETPKIRGYPYGIQWVKVPMEMACSEVKFSGTDYLIYGLVDNYNHRNLDFFMSVDNIAKLFRISPGAVRKSIRRLKDNELLEEEELDPKEFKTGRKLFAKKTFYKIGRMEKRT